MIVKPEDFLNTETKVNITCYASQKGTGGINVVSFIDKYGEISSGRFELLHNGEVVRTYSNIFDCLQDYNEQYENR